MRLDVITKALSSVADVTNKSGLGAALLWGDVEEAFVETSLAVLNEKVFSDSS